MRRLDLTNHRFGHLLAIKPGSPRFFGAARHSTWLCKCDCGETATVETQKLRSGRTQSCGCISGRRIRPGDRYGRLVTLNEASHRIWLCACDCGNQKEVGASNLGRSVNSCGCLAREYAANRPGHRHNTRNSREYRIWRNIKSRCFNPKVRSYVDYGERGITMCDSWRHSFESFLEDMGACPDGLSIERINNDGDYEPTNCKWAPQAAQVLNRRNTLRYNGRPLKEIARERGINYYTLRVALLRGEDPMTFVPRRR